MTDTVRLNLDEMLQRFKFLGERIGPTVYTAMLVSAQKMLRDVVTKRMSEPRRGSTATNLGVDTGTARRSMIDMAGIEADRVFALIGSPQPHVKVHEEGFHGRVQVPSHIRRNVSLSRNAKTGLVSKISARRYKRAVRAGRKVTSFVRAHSRKLDIVAKRFIRDTVQESIAPIENRILQGLMIAAKTGRVPTPRELGA